MGSRNPRTLFGVEIIYMRDHVARKVVAIVSGGRSVWALLPDGRVGTNDAEFFKYSYGKGSRSEVHVAEVLWQLGKMKKSEYQKLYAAREKKEAGEHRRRAVVELKCYAKQIGLLLTKEQQSAIDKISA